MDRWGIATVQQLRRAGWSKAALKTAVLEGRLWHVRRGYYARPDADPALVRAVRVGGRATGATALRAHGVWTWRQGRAIHVVVPQNAARLRHPDRKLEPLEAHPDVHVHWQEPDPVTPGLLCFTPTVDVLTALAHAGECEEDELLVAMIDSALNLGLLRSSDLTRLHGMLPEGRRHLLDEVDGRAQAGGESVVRIRLRRAGFRVEVQRSIRRVGRVDLVVDGVLIVEVDGREFHDGEQFAEDRRRDLELTIQGRPHLRLTYDQVFDRWASCEQAIATALLAA